MTLVYSIQGAALSSFILFIVELAAIDIADAETPRGARIREGYPAEILARLKARDQMLSQALAVTPSTESPITVQYFLNCTVRWDSGSTVTVAFSGGSPELRAKIEGAANEWTKYCNLKFDFREHGKFREWSASDQKYQAQIRIAFDRKGYWSALGDESVTPNYYRPDQPSMNFEGFPSDPPYDLPAIVQHEFGHAIGFQHEHQHPEERCDEELRWENDAGYIPTRNEWKEFIPDAYCRKPGVYRVFGGPPTNWPKEWIDGNIRQIINNESHAFKIGPFDPESIMKYYFEDWLFIDGCKSRCYHKYNDKISAGDRAGAAAVYPKARQDIKQALDEKKRCLDLLLRTKNLSPQFKKEFRMQRDSLPN
jgi:hypothetical protein